MKISINLIICFFSLLFFSCAKDDTVSQDFTIEAFLVANFPQKWKLVGIKSVLITNAEVVKIEDADEHYIFNEDYTFQKRSVIENELIVLEGTFSIDERDFVILEYTQESALIASCSNQSKTEFLRFSGGQLINSDALTCDALYYYYKKVE